MRGVLAGLRAPWSRLPSWRGPSLAGRAGVASSLPASPTCHPGPGRASSPELGTQCPGPQRTLPAAGALWPEQAALPGECGSSSHCCPRGSLLGGESGGRGHRAQVSRECKVGSSTQATPLGTSQVPVPSTWGSHMIRGPHPLPLTNATSAGSTYPDPYPQLPPFPTGPSLH